MNGMVGVPGMPPPLPPMGGMPGIPAMPAIPGMPAMPAIPPTMPGIPPTMPGIPPTNPIPSTPLAGNTTGNLSGTTTNQVNLIYTRTDLSMEEWRALQPQYRYQEFLTEANAVV